MPERLLRVRCWVCGCPIRLHDERGCQGRQQLLPGVPEPCVCGLDADEAAAESWEAESDAAG